MRTERVTVAARALGRAFGVTDDGTWVASLPSWWEGGTLTWDGTRWEPAPLPRLVLGPDRVGFTLHTRGEWLGVGEVAWPVTAWEQAQADARAITGRRKRVRKAWRGEVVRGDLLPAPVAVDPEAVLATWDALWDAYTALGLLDPTPVPWERVRTAHQALGRLLREAHDRED